MSIFDNTRKIFKPNLVFVVELVLELTADQPEKLPDNVVGVRDRRNFLLVVYSDLEPKLTRAHLSSFMISKWNAFPRATWKILRLKFLPLNSSCSYKPIYKQRKQVVVVRPFPIVWATALSIFWDCFFLKLVEAGGALRTPSRMYGL